MYRHFAVLTVAVTLVVGVFADGDSRQAVASEVHAAQKPAEATPDRLVRKDARATGSFSSDGGYDGAFGAPMDTAGAAPQDGVLPDGFAAIEQGGIPAGYSRYGAPADTWASLTDEQKRRLMEKQMAAEAAAQAPERAAQIDSLLAASRARSGEATKDD
jgi:hypothetical protein